MYRVNTRNKIACTTLNTSQDSDSFYDTTMVIKILLRLVLNCTWLNSSRYQLYGRFLGVCNGYDGHGYELALWYSTSAG